MFWFLRICSLLRVLLIRMRANATRQHQRKNADNQFSYKFFFFLSFFSLSLSLLWLLCVKFLQFFLYSRVYENFLNFFFWVVNFLLSYMTLSFFENLTFVISFWHRRTFYGEKKRGYMWEVCKVNGWEENKEGVEEEESEWVRKIERITGGKRCKETAVLCWVNGISFGKKFITDFTLFYLQIEVRWNFSVLDHSAHFFFITPHNHTHICTIIFAWEMMSL